jgi:SAM-dependent methyltransferase
MLPPTAIQYSQPSVWIREHLLDDFSLTDFAAADNVLDVGCGYGKNLELLIANGVNATGIDSDPKAVTWCKAHGLPVSLAAAEFLPFESDRFSGALLDSVLQYTNPTKTLSELARVLKPGGVILICTQGLGYALHTILSRRGLARFYGFRMILNSLIFRLTLKRLPSCLGDTLCYYPKHLINLGERFGFEVQKNQEGKRYASLPVFLYLRLKKK